MILYVLVGIAVAAAIAVALAGLGRSLQPADELEQRIEDWVSAGGPRALDDEGLNEERSFILQRMERTISRQSFAQRTRTDLARADLSLTVTEYLLMRAGIVVLGALVGYWLNRELLGGLLLGVVCFFVPIVYVRMRQGQRLRNFNGQLPDVLDHLVGSLRAGYGLLQAVEWVAKQMPHPAGSEFERVVREVQLGRSLTDSFDSMVRRLESDDLALIVTAIKIHHEVGGSLAEILETVAHTIRERVRIQREIQVLTAQQRYSGYVLMLLPIGLAIFLFITSPEYEKQLFTPGPTLCIPIGTVIMMVIGFFVMRRIIDIDV
jgi:tight adherence protein B